MKIPMSSPNLSETDVQAVAEVVRSGRLALGPQAREFERLVAAYVGVGRRPGITGPATLKFRDEELLLAQQPDPERYNCEVIYPQKVRLNRRYIENYSFAQDIAYIWQTIFGDSPG